MKVMFVVTHLLGTGHLTRALNLAKAIKEVGHNAVVVSGGMPPKISASERPRILQLPPVRSDGVDFSRLLDADGTKVTASYLAERQRSLLQALTDEGPDVVVTELFPFGRRVLKKEFLAFLNACKTQTKKPKIYASIRDILAPPSKPEKAKFAEETVSSLYDAVLVHSDPSITPLEKSWPVSAVLKEKLLYTGFVAPPAAELHPDSFGKGEVIVSAGGGEVGQSLYLCAKEASKLDGDRIWRMLIGGRTPEQRIAELQSEAPQNLIVEPARPDFRQMLHHAAASISLCGYNTALDLLQTNCPSVFVPFDDGNEVEQTIRARSLATQSGIEMLQSRDLSPERLFACVKNVVKAQRDNQNHTMAYGAQRSAKILTSGRKGSDGN